MTMRSIFFIIWLSAIVMCAQGSPLQGGKSPSGKFEVILEKETTMKGAKEGKEELFYILRDTASGKTLLAIRSSYQAENRDQISSALENAAGAEVSWSKDESKVAIDEENIRYRGKVFVIALTSPNSAALVLIPEHEVISQSGDEWERYRIRVDKGWKDNDSLILSMAGNVKTHKLGVYQNKTHRFILQIPNDLHATPRLIR